MLLIQPRYIIAIQSSKRITPAITIQEVTSLLDALEVLQVTVGVFIISLIVPPG